MPRIVWTGDVTSADRANQTAAAGVKKVGTEAATTVKSLAQLNREALKIKESLDPQEKLNRKYAELGQHVQKGRLSIEQATAAGVKYRNELGLAARAGQDVARSHDQAFGSRLASNLAAGALGVVGITRLVGVLTKGFDDAAAAARKAVDDSFGALNIAGELQLLSKSPEDFTARVAESRSLVTRGIVRPSEQVKAFETVSNLTQAGFDEGEREVLYRAAERKQVTDIVGLGGKLRSAQDIFGKGDTGTIAQTLDKVAQASQELLEGTSETAAEIPNFASEARALGVDMETALAAYVAIRKQSSTREIAGTRERQLFDNLDSQDLWKGDLPSTLADIRKRVESGEKLKDILPSIRGRAGYRALTTPEGQALFEQQLPLIQGAEGLVEKKQFLSADPRLGALHAKEVEEGRLATTVSEVEEERQSLFDAAVAARKNRQLDKGIPLPMRAIDAASQSARNWLGLEDITIREEFKWDAERPRMTKETRDRMEEYLRRIDQKQSAKTSTRAE